MITESLPSTDLLAVTCGIQGRNLILEFGEEENKLEMADTQAEIILSQGTSPTLFTTSIKQARCKGEFGISGDAYARIRTHARVHDGHIVSEPYRGRESSRLLLSVKVPRGYKKKSDMLQLQRRRTCCEGSLKRKELCWMLKLKHSSIDVECTALMITSGIDLQTNMFSSQIMRMHMTQTWIEGPNACCRLSWSNLYPLVHIQQILVIMRNHSKEIKSLKMGLSGDSRDATKG
ncbi:hypothetical protein Tco_1094130 [Tanacetum coccineum]|uniref:Uncharacterized protein n=1 Tax=Tanacetum coccineum TaxID=301880 RepID=A0ABQ5IEP0_9ASTR